jgi:hypothetical protein
VVGVEQLNHLTGPGEWLHKLLPMELTGMTSFEPHGSLQEWLKSKERFDGQDYNFTYTGQAERNRSGSFENPSPGWSPIRNSKRRRCRSPPDVCVTGGCWWDLTTRRWSSPGTRARPDHAPDVCAGTGAVPLLEAGALFLGEDDRSPA